MRKRDAVTALGCRDWWRRRLFFSHRPRVPEGIYFSGSDKEAPAIRHYHATDKPAITHMQYAPTIAQQHTSNIRSLYFCVQICNNYQIKVDLVLIRSVSPSSRQSLKEYQMHKQMRWRGSWECNRYSQNNRMLCKINTRNEKYTQKCAIVKETTTESISCHLNRPNVNIFAQAHTLYNPLHFWHVIPLLVLTMLYKML